ncbi:MAG: N-acetylglucosamine kinase [Chloroflexota bacterium]
MSPARHLLAVDGGNSKTLAVVGDERGEALGAGRSGGSNHQAVGLGEAMTQVLRAVEEALTWARLEPASISAAFFAMAGADLPEDFELLTPALHDLDLVARLELDNDSIAALWSGTESPNAVAVVWGAGTNAVGRNAAGAEVRLPALGPISGDWGGGGDLSEEAIWLVARAHDGRGEATMLTHMVLRALNAPDVEELIRRLYCGEIGEPHSLPLAPLVFRAAAAGDAVACDLVGRCGREVATTATAVLRRLDLLDATADVVLAGSVFKAEGPLFLDAVRESLREAAPRARLVLPDVEPVIGALFGTMSMLDIPVDEAARERARDSYGRLTHGTQREVASR